MNFTANLLSKLQNPDDVPTSYILINKVLARAGDRGFYIKCFSGNRYIDSTIPSSQLPTDMEILNYYSVGQGFYIKCMDRVQYVDHNTPASEMPNDWDIINFWY